MGPDLSRGNNFHSNDRHESLSFPQNRHRRVTPRLVQSVSATARQLGVSELTIRRHIRDGRLTAFQIGGTWRSAGPRLARIEDLPDSCTVAQIAHSLDVSELTVRRYIRAGELPATKHSRSWVIKRSDLEQLLSPICAAAAEG